MRKKIAIRVKLVALLALLITAAVFSAVCSIYFAYSTGRETGILPMLVGVASMVTFGNGSTKSKKNYEIEEACEILKEIVKVLKNPRRINIINALPPGVTKTFDQLKAETGLSTGSLHHHLKELWIAGFIYKTNERPAKFGRTAFLEHLIALVEHGKRETMEDPTKVWSVSQLKPPMAIVSRDRG